MADVMEQDPEIITSEPESNSGTEAVETPVTGLPQGSSSVDDRSLDDLLAEYDAKTRQAESEPGGEKLDGNPPNQDASGELDELLAQLSGPSPDQQRIGELEGELNAVRAAEFQRQELAAAEKFFGEVQSLCPPTVPDDYARNALLSIAAQDANLAASWQYRGLTNEQLAQADRAFRELEVLYHRTVNTPDNGDPRRQQAIAWMEQRGAQLNTMLSARATIWNAKRSVVKRAESFKPIDEDQTQVHMEVAAAIRGASTPIIPERPPNFGTMTDAEFRDYTKKNFGF
jgi:hypothetical protein